MKRTKKNTSTAGLKNIFVNALVKQNLALRSPLPDAISRRNETEMIAGRCQMDF
jgi:hypothetical protein